MTILELEQALGPRGKCFVKAGDNRSLVKRWLRMRGIPGGTVELATLRELADAYNDSTDSHLNNLVQTVEFRRAAKAADDKAAAALADLGKAIESPTPHAPPADGPPHVAAGFIEAAILDLVQGRVKAGVDRDEVTRIVDERLADAAGMLPRRILVDIPGREAVEMDGQHAIFDRVLKLVLAGESLFIVGPAGCGKTTLCAALAKAQQHDFTYLAGSAGQSESVVTGWLLPGEGGAFVYSPSEFVRLYERGNATILLDEFCAFDPNMTIVLNAALANGHFSVPQRRDNPLVKRGDNVVLIAADNTHGFGPDRIYSGRNQMDGATLDRFTIVEMDYDRALESRLGAAGGLTASEMADLWSLRDKVRENKLSRIVSTRAFTKAGNMKRAGDSWETVLATLTSGWTRDELAKAGRAVR